MMEANGGSPFYAPQQCRLLREAGFASTEGFAFTECLGSTEAKRQSAATYEAYFRRPAFADVAIGRGWIDRESLEAGIAELRASGESPDAYSATLYCAALGWA